MATRQSVPKAGRGRIQKAPIPEALHEAIENERSNLSRAESVLGCLAISMESEPDPVNGPYYPDVAQLARELVRQSINGLDSLTLQKVLLRNKVKESCVSVCIERAYPVLDMVPVLDAVACALPLRSRRALPAPVPSA